MEIYHAIGLMSGTSLDGLDICHARLSREEFWSFEILNSETVAYSYEWESRLKNCTHLSAERLLQLHTDYGFYLGEAVNHFLTKNKITTADVIASHGHTVFHQPENRFTTQIGDGRAIKIVTGIPVAYDFRTQDVLLKGNGAPLVPIGDELLFGNYDACINLGGFSNISFKKDGERIAFDICPVNFVLNKYAQKLGYKYDVNGGIARNENIDGDLLEKLNVLDFYQLPAPKSLGFEWVEAVMEPILKAYPPETILATFTAHAAQQIVDIINENNLESVLITGGGAYNSYLIELIKSQTTAGIIIPENAVLEFKEALIFAFMGVLRLIGEDNVLSSATGSSRNHCSGLLV